MHPLKVVDYTAGLCVGSVPGEGRRRSYLKPASTIDSLSGDGPSFLGLVRADRRRPEDLDYLANRYLFRPDMD